MRDPNRIPEFLAVLQKCWEKVPDWRFGQLIENLKRYANIYDLFYIEEDKLEQILTEWFELNK